MPVIKPQSQLQTKVRILAQMNKKIKNLYQYASPCKASRKTYMKNCIYLCSVWK